MKIPPLEKRICLLGKCERHFYVTKKSPNHFCCIPHMEYAKSAGCKKAQSLANFMMALNKNYQRSTFASVLSERDSRNRCEASLSDL